MDVAIDHLWSLDHRRIAFLCEWEERETPDCAARRESYIRAVCRRGGEPIVITWPWALDGLVDHLATQGVSAVACWSESIAGRLLLKLKEAGISVPRDLSVIGFDSTLYCETTKPRLTAVRQPIRDMGAYATQTLLSLISGAEPSRFSKVFPCTLDVRDSTTVCLKAEVTV
jgi:LacI family transcriptional regulator